MKSTDEGAAPAAQLELSLIRKRLKHFTTEVPVRYWLQTGDKMLNAVLGSASKGIPYGKVVELSGFESHGKTLLALELARCAQRDGAAVGWLDLEDSWDERWAKVRGIDLNKVVLFRRELVLEGNKEPRILSLEELLTEAESWMKLRYKKNPDGRIYLAVDSVAAMAPEEEMEAGLMDQNMRTKLSLAAFLSMLMKRWVALASVYNVLLVMTNQLRMSPNVRFGDPTYSPGGNALRHYCSIRARLKRVKGGKLLKGGKLVGIKGSVRNLKNKAGGGSVEGQKVGFKAFFSGGKLQFVPIEDLEDKEE